MNTSKFVYKGVELDLDLDDLEVDARVQRATDNLRATREKLSKDKSGTSIVQLYLQAIRDFLNEAFGREDAADLLLAGIGRLSQVNEAFGVILTNIGEMRGLVTSQAQGAMTASVEKVRAKKAKK